MAIRAAFVGVDRFADPGIRDLYGCRRDALALHALFTDSVDGIEAELLLDENATAERVRSALGTVLDGAGPDDVAIISFSGHGTRDHRLVVHDALRGDLASTAIGMDDLAARFRRSKARVVLCILDCCFSGGAPARVLEDSPTSRDLGTPLDQVAGEGRLLIAASGIDEPALEAGGHGLLTRALIEALQSDHDTVSVVAAIDAVMARVRAEAARLGFVQTPVMFGHVEGGLSLPALRKGDQWNAAFPAERRHTFSGAIDELAAFGIPANVLEAWKESFPNGLNALQLAAVNDHGVLDGRSLLVVAPTSSGKTFIGELAAARAVAERRRAVFLFPYKALTNEKYDQFCRLYGEQLGLRVIRCTSDAHDQISEFVRGKYDMALFTYEMFLNVALSSPWTVDLVGLVVVDEAQFVADPRRGIVVELLLTHLRRARERGTAPQLVALSAVIGDLNGFDGWLGGEALVTTERPVPLVEGVLDRRGRYRYREASGAVKDEQLLPHGAVVQRGQKPGAQDVIVPLVRQILSERVDERVIVFRNRRGPAEGCAAYLAKELGLPPADNVIAALPLADPSTSSRRLRDCLAGGTAFHNSNLIPEERVLVERAFRDPKGQVRVLAATTTVAAGINTPASTVVLAEHEFLGEDGRPFSVAEYKNMAGRAGRLGFNERGRAIILADESVSADFLFQKYVLGSPEPLRSSFHPDEIDTWVLRLLSQVKDIARSEVAGLLAATYGGYLASRDRPGWSNETQASLEGLLSEMIELRLLEEERGVVRLTLLGRACGRSSLSFRSAMRLVRMLEREPDPASPERLLVAIQALPECDADYTPLMKKGASEDRWPRTVATVYGRQAALTLQEHADDAMAYRARCKRVMVIHNWIAGVPVEQIESGTTTNPYQGAITAGHVRQFANTARFHMRSACEIAGVVLLDAAPSAEAVDVLLYRLEFGIPAEVVHLAQSVPVSWDRGELQALFRAGVHTPEELWKLPAETLERLLGAVRAQEIQGLRPSPS